jgi:hypothetical protein
MGCTTCKIATFGFWAQVLAPRRVSNSGAPEHTGGGVVLASGALQDTGNGVVLVGFGFVGACLRPLRFSSLPIKRPEVHVGFDRKAVDLDSPRALVAAGERGLVGKQLLVGPPFCIEAIEPPPRERRLPAGVERGGWRESERCSRCRQRGREAVRGVAAGCTRAWLWWSKPSGWRWA